MTVAELLEKLKEFPPNLPVYLPHDEWGDVDVYEVRMNGETSIQIT